MYVCVCSCVRVCVCLMINFPAESWALNTWPQLVVLFGALGGMVSLEEVHHWGWAFGSSGVISSSLCFLLMVQDVSLGFLLLTPYLCPVVVDAAPLDCKPSPVFCKLCWLWCFITEIEK